MQLTQEQYTEKFNIVIAEMIALQEKKGNDYGEEEDGLKNLRRRGPSGVIARMGDKLSRLESLTRPGRVAKTDESIKDTLIDYANYSILLIILLKAGDSLMSMKERTWRFIQFTGSMDSSLSQMSSTDYLKKLQSLLANLEKNWILVSDVSWVENLLIASASISVAMIIQQEVSA